MLSNLKNITDKLLSLFVKYEHKYKEQYSKLPTPAQLYVFYNLVRNNGELDLKNQGWSSKTNYIFDNKSSIRFFKISNLTLTS